jgi:endonuclease/exonuclease/phosphatase family metal-dependent hydrolase
MSISRISALSLAGVMLASGAAAETIKVATWNIENLTVGSRTAAELAALRELVDLLDADVIALQEVDGAEAAQQIFDEGEYVFHFSTQDNPQLTGFAIREGVAFTANPDLVELDIGDVRRGADLTVMLGDQPIRLLSVHLKSFCHQNDLDNVSPNDNTDCGKLKRQIPILEGWIEDRAQEGVPVVVLGDFNRRFNIADDDMWREIDDGDPDLTKHTEGLMSTCLNSQFPEYIDHIVTDMPGTALVRPGSFAQLLFTTVDPGGQADLSDHCPISVVFDSIGTTDGDAVAVLVERLDAVQAELQDIRNAVSALRE